MRSLISALEVLLNCALQIDIYLLTYLLDGIQVKFIYKGYWVKVRVTGAKKVENSHFRNAKL